MSAALEEATKLLGLMIEDDVETYEVRFFRGEKEELVGQVYFTKDGRHFKASVVELEEQELLAELE